MNKSSYEEQARQLVIAIDIAIASFQLYPPNIWDDGTKKTIINTYLSWKNSVQHPELKFKNKQSLSYLINDVFVYFQESSGDAVNYFWHQIKDSGLEYKRKNKLQKILKRKKIKNKIEYDFIIDTIIPYQQEGIISDTEVNLLNRLLLEFEN